MDKEYRIKKFMEEYEALTKKYNVDFANYPMYFPDGKGGFKTITQVTPIDLEEQKKITLNEVIKTD